MNFVPSAEQLASIFSQAAAPAFLIGGIAAFISVLMGRLNGIVDRLRHLSDIADGDPVHGKYKADIPFLKRRASLLHRAAYLALLAGIATTLLLMLSVLSAFLKLQHLYGGGLLFGIATALLSVALYKFAQEVRLALVELDRY
jgi:hypothetical protein